MIRATQHRCQHTCVVRATQHRRRLSTDTTNAASEQLQSTDYEYAEPEQQSTDDAYALGLEVPMDVDGGRTSTQRTLLVGFNCCQSKEHHTFRRVCVVGIFSQHGSPVNKKPKTNNLRFFSLKKHPQTISI